MREVTTLELENISGGDTNWNAFVWSLAAAATTIVAIPAVVLAVVQPETAPVAWAAVGAAANSWNNLLHS